MYFQWGYSRQWYSRSDLHFSRGGAYDFTIHRARATDEPAFESFITAPLHVTIPQNNARIGLYLNAARTRAVEINYDHAKYVMVPNQRARLTGTFGDHQVDADTVIRPDFLQFEHTDGANFWHLNYAVQEPLWQGRRHLKATAILKAGAGLVVPRTDVEIFGKQLDKGYRVSGYIFSAEAGARFYCSRHLFLEATGKGGFANYHNVLTVEGGRANHKFWYGEVVGLLGFELGFKQTTKSSEQ